MERLLVVDDEEEIANSYKRILERRGYLVDATIDVENAKRLISDIVYDIVITDLKMPGEDGLKLLKYIKDEYINTSVIIITGQATIETALESLKIGAYDYILKPINANELIKVVEKCIEHIKLKRQEKIFREITALYQQSQEVSKKLSQKELLEMILQHAVKSLNADSGSILMCLPNSDVLVPTIFVGRDNIPENGKQQAGPISTWVAQTKQSLLLQNGLNNIPQFKDIPTRSEIRSSMVSPLLNRDKMLGVICLNRFVHSSSSQFTNNDIEALKIFALHATLIITDLQYYISQKELEEFKSDFMANISHELRTPLMAISGAVELIYQITKEDEKIKTFLDLISRNTTRMKNMVNELLEFSRIEKKETRINPSLFDLKELCDETIKDIEYNIKEKNLTIDTSYDQDKLEIYADREKIKQIVLNLIYNAIKFTYEGGTIRITASQSKDSKIILSVSDTGIGIPDDKLNKIFDKFYQVDSSSSRKYNGFGLGLSIVKHLVDMHLGKIEVKSTLGKGSTFTVTLPKDFTKQT